MPMALICYIIWGAPLSAILMWDTILQHTQHHVKTGFGITKESYKYTDTNPIIGPGQGSKAGSPTCSTLIFMLLMVMDKLAKGMKFCSPNKKFRYKAKAIVFADDNTNCNNDFKKWIAHPPTQTEVINNIQHDSQTWERCLYTSGGKLKLPKCNYYMMMWEFNNKGKANLIPKKGYPL